MCADSVNFGDYLVRNDKWLLENGETENTEAGDGELSDREISIFFSNSHINSDGNDEISADEFNNWYKNNESAISAYLNDIGADYDDPEVKAAMLESMNEYAQTKAEVELQHLNDEYDGTKLGDVDMPGAEEIDDEPTVDDSPTIEPTTPADPTTPTDPSTPDEPTTPEATPGEAPAEYTEAAQDLYNQMKELTEAKDSWNNYEDKVDEIIKETVNNRNITYDERLSLLEDFADMDKDTVQSYFAEDDSFYYSTINEIYNSGNYSTQDIIDFTTRYNQVQGNANYSYMVNTGYGDPAESQFCKNAVEVLLKAQREGMVDELLAAGFVSPSIIADLIQYNSKGDEETGLLTNLLTAIGSDKSQNYSDYGLSEQDAKNLEDNYYKGSNKETLKSIVSAYRDGEISKEQAMYLMQNYFNGSMASIISSFRDMMSFNEEKYIKYLFDIYS